MASLEESETKSIITGLLTSNPLRSTIKQLCDDFVNTVGYKIPVRKLGFPNVEEYLRSIPDTVRVYGSGSSAEVEGVIKAKSAHINLMVARQKKDSIPVHKRRHIKRYQRLNQESPFKPSTSQGQSTINNKPPTSVSCGSKGYFSSPATSVFEDEYRSKVPPMIQNNLRKLILRFPDGIWCTRLPTEYRKMFQTDISYQKYNYRSLIEMCSDLSEIFHYIQPTSDDFMLYDKYRPIPSLNQNDAPIKQKLKENKQVSATQDFDWSNCMSLIPPDVVHLSDEILRYFPPNVQVGDYLDVTIGEIYDVSKFWMYVTYGDLEALMKELHEFFHTQRNRYVIPEVLLEEGLYCTVQYKNEYHRCVIIDLLPQVSGFVEVLFIDYGSIGDVSSKEIWYLPKQFSEVPSQAIRARLSNIRPNQDIVQCTNKFRQLIMNSELVAEVTKVDKKDLILEIYLADVTNEQNISYINDALVEKGYAYYI